MDLLFQSLATLAEERFGTIVHVGAGGGAGARALLDAYAEHDWQRLVLVEGDDDAVAELRTQAHRRHHVRIVDAVVTPNGGQVDWHRFIPRSFSGPLDATGLKDIYQRLRLLGRTSVASIAFSELLADCALHKAEGRSDLLVLDVPGQEAALLAAVDPQSLSPFDFVLVRGCAGPLFAGGASLECSELQLRERHYECLPLVGEAEPIWPTKLFRFDAVAEERAVLRARSEALQLALSARDADLADLRHSAAQRLAESEQRLANTELRRADSEQRVEALTQAAAEAAAERAKSLVELEVLREALASAQAAVRVAEAARADDRHQLEQAASHAEEVSSLLASSSSTVESLRSALEAKDAELADLRHSAAQRLAGTEQRLEALTQAAAAAAAERARSLVEFEALREALASAQAAVRDAEAARAEDRNQLEQAASHAEEVSSLLASSGSTVNSLRSALEAKDAELADLRRGATQLAGENERRLEDLAQEAEAARGAARLCLEQATTRAEELSSRLTEMTAQRDQERHWHEENAKWARGLTLQVEQSKQDLARVEAELAASRATAQALAGASTALEEMERAHAALSQQHALKLTEHEALDAQCRRLTHDCEQAVKEQQRTTQQMRELEQRNADLAGTVTRLETELAEALQSVQQSSKRLDSALQQNEQQSARQQLMDAEIVKLEAQLSLVKDILISEKNF